MTEDQESSEDKQSKLKLKLKKMGVMQDENTHPEFISKPFWRGKLPILLVVFFAIGFIGWISRNDLTSNMSDMHTNSVSNDNLSGVQTPFYPPSENMQANTHYPPPPPAWNRAPLYNSDHRVNRANRAMGPAAGPHRPAYTNRYYGPPPGWQPYRGYPPPPPPVFYGQPNYYGPPPGFYSNPGYRGYNAPPRPPE